MTKRLYILLFIGLLWGTYGYSQHFPIYSQYMMNGLAINPAYAGSREVFSATALLRRQWVGFDGAPGIISLGAHMPFRNQKVALGLLAGNETVGVEKNTSLYFNYAYRIGLGKGKLALGLKGGFNLATEESSKLSLQNASGDKAFENLKESAFMPNFGFGAYYSTSVWFAGVSLPSLLDYRSGGDAATGLKTYTLLITGGYLHRFSDQFKIKPSTLVKYHYESTPQVDINLNMIFFKDDILWIGGSYRHKESLVSLFEVQISRKLRLGYSYDYSIGPISKYNSGSHEVMIRYEWRDKVNTLNPLYF